MPLTIKRIDHGPYCVEIWVGLFLSGLYVLIQPQILTSISSGFENFIAAVLMAGSGLCLWGAAMGTPYFYPNAELITSYRLQMVGLPIISIVLGTLAVATDVSAVAQFTLSGGLGVPVQIASLRMLVKLWTETKLWGKAPAAVTERHEK